MTQAPEPTTETAPPVTQEEQVDFGNAMFKAMGVTPVDVQPPKEDAPKPEPEKKSDKPAEPVKQDDDIPSEIKSEKAKEGWREVKKNLAAARKAEEELKAKVADYEKKLAEKSIPQIPEEVTKRLAQLEQESQDLSERLRVADVEKHPKFQQYFEGKTATLTDAAKQIVGAEHSGKIERILKMTDDDAKTQMLDELMGELSPARSARLGAVISDLEMLQRERAGEISKAKERWNQLQEQSNSEKQAALRSREVLADRLVEAAAQLEAFKPGESQDTARAAEIGNYRAFIKQAITGKLEAQDEQMMPLMAVEGLHLKTKVLPGLLEKLSDMEKRLAEYETAKPRPGASTGFDQPKSFLDIVSGRA